MEKILSNHINFKSMFYDLYQQNIGELEENRVEKKHYNDIINFTIELKDFEVSVDYCEIESESIIFGFYQETSSANESNPDSDGIIVLIEYNRLVEQFVDFNVI